MGVFWVVAPCSLVEVYRRLIALTMEAARSSGTLADFYQTTRCYKPEDSHLTTYSVSIYTPQVLVLVLEMNCVSVCDKVVQEYHVMITLARHAILIFLRNY
jgi:hypothetical protein